MKKGILIQMIVTVLSENTSLSPEIRSEHGLSLHISTGKCNMLFDAGAGPLFLDNAKKLGVDIPSVDIAVISHGHYDHGGGLSHFLRVNSKAKVYINRHAFERHYSLKEGKEKFIGIDRTSFPPERFIYVDQDMAINGDLEIFSGVMQEIFSPSCNSALYMREDGKEKLNKDDFRHEQNLIIRDGLNTLLLTGCAHNGIVNILEHYVKKYGSLPTHVIGGFHLYSHSEGKDEDPLTVFEIGRYLLDSAAEYYTGHCTGEASFSILKRTMGEMLHKISAGSIIKIA